MENEGDGKGEWLVTLPVSPVSDFINFHLEHFSKSGSKNKGKFGRKESRILKLNKQKHGK